MKATIKGFSVASIIFASSLIVIFIGIAIYYGYYLAGLNPNPFNSSSSSNDNASSFYLPLLLGSLIYLAYYGTIAGIIISLLAALVAVGGLVASIQMLKKIDINTSITSIIFGVMTANIFSIVSGIIGLVSLKKEKKQEVKPA